MKKLLLCLVLLSPFFAISQVYREWTGSGSNWSSTGNWTSGGITYSQLEWKGNGLATSNNDAGNPYSTWRLFFTGSKGYTLTGNPVSLFDYSGNNSWVLSQATANQTINLGINFYDSGSRTSWITTESSGSLTLGGAIDIGGGVTALRIAGANTSGTITFNGAISGSSKPIDIGVDQSGNVQTNSRVFFNGTNTYSGPTTIYGGTLSVSSNSALGTGNLNIGNAANTTTFAVTGTTTRTQNIAITDLSAAGVIDVASGQTFTLSGNLNGGATNSTKYGKAGAGTFLVNAASSAYNGQIQIGDGTVIVQTSLGANTSTSNRGVDLGLNVGDVSTANNVSLLTTNGVSVGQSIYIAPNTGSATRTLGLSGTGSCTFSNEIYIDGNVTLNGGSGTVNMTGNMINTGGVIVSGGTVVYSGNNKTYTGATNVTGGTLSIVKSGYTATITPSGITVAFSSIPSPGTYTVLTGALTSTATLTPTGLGTGQIASFNAATGAVTIANAPPVRTAGTVTPLTINEDAASTSLGLNSVAYDAVESGQTLAYAVTSVPSASLGNVTLSDGTVVSTGAYTLSQIQGMKFVPAANANGSGTFSYSVTDNGGTANGGSNTLSESIAITVNAVNDAPVRTAGSVNPLTVNEDSAATSLGLSAVTYGPGGGADEAAQTLTYTVTSVPSASLGNVTLSDGTVVSTGAYTLSQIQGMKFVPTTNANGSGAFTYSVTDNGGTANGGVNTISESIAITVNAVNDAPVRTGGSVNPLTVNEDSAAASLGLSAVAYGPGGGADEASQTLTYTVTSVPLSSLGNVTLSDGTVVSVGTYTLSQLQGMKFVPAANANGTGTFSYSVTDNGGTANGGVNTLSESLSITVNAVNDAPVRTSGSVNPLTVNEDAPATSLGLSGVAYGPGGGADEASQTLTYTVTSVPAASLGTITLADGVTTVTASTAYTLTQIQGMKFVPAANANGTGTFSYSVTDNGGTANGGVNTLSESIAITVNAVNDAPVRTGGSVNPLTVNEDAPATSLGLSGVTYGPGGGADEASQTLTYTVTSVPLSSLGNITLSDGTVVTTGAYTLSQLQGMKFVPAANAFGSGVFSYSITDNGGTANGGSNTMSESIAITVNGISDAPIITGTYCAGATSVSGTDIEPNGTIINLYVAGSTLIGSTTVSGGNWTVAVSALSSNDVLTATASASGQSISVPSSGVTVSATPPTPTITAGGPTTFCSGGSVTLTSSAASGYLWSTNATTSSITVTASGSYTVRASNASGCLSAASTPVVVSVTPQLSWYLDADGDHYYTGSAVASCTSPGAGYTTSVLGGGDCDDSNAGIYPGAAEICYNGILENCSGTLSQGCAPVVVNMTPSYNNTTLTSLSQAIPAVAYSYGNFTNLKYRFSITNTTTGVTAADIIQTSRYVTIPASLHSYPGTYTIKASAVINEEIVAYAGNTITVTAPTVQVITLSSANCGATLASLSATLAANAGPNATGYTFRIRTNDANPTPTYATSQSATRYIGANTFTGFPLQYSASYKISVRYTYNDPVTNQPVEAPYGAECTVNTPSIPLTNMASPTCGSQVTAMNANMSAAAASYATSYQFRIRLFSDNSATPTYYYSVPNASRFSSLTAFQGITLAYNTGYSISVQYSVLNGSTTVWSGYGPECKVTTPFFPTTSLVPSQCGQQTATSLTQQLNITPYPGFPNYKVKLDEVSGEDIVNSQEIIVTYPYFKLSQFSIAQLGKNYNVSVAIKLNGVFGDYDTACDLHTPGNNADGNNGGGSIVKTLVPFKATAYPNPFANDFMIDVKTSSQSIVNLKVYDMIGRMIEQREVKVSDMESTLIGNSYPSGVYNVVVSQDDSVETVRVVKR